MRKSELIFPAEIKISMPHQSLYAGPAIGNCQVSQVPPGGAEVGQ